MQAEKVSFKERERMVYLRKTDGVNVCGAHIARGVCFGQITPILGKKQSFFKAKTQRVQ